MPLREPFNPTGAWYETCLALLCPQKHVHFQYWRWQLVGLTPDGQPEYIFHSAHTSLLSTEDGTRWLIQDIFSDA